jgi:hypothetical protein
MNGEFATTSFPVRLLIAVLIIWLVQTILSALEVKEPARKIIFVFTVIVMVAFAFFGYMIP